MDANINTNAHAQYPTACCNGVFVRLAAKDSTPLLPSPADPCTSAANDSVQQVSTGKRRKRGRYQHYDAEVRAKIAKHACQSLTLVDANMSLFKKR